LKKRTKENLINIGNGKDKSIIQYAKIIMKYLNHHCKIKLNSNMPNGTPQKVLNVTLAKKLGWTSKISLEKGLDLTYKDFIKRYWYG